MKSGASVCCDFLLSKNPRIRSLLYLLFEGEDVFDLSKSVNSNHVVTPAGSRIKVACRNLHYTFISPFLAADRPPYTFCIQTMKGWSVVDIFSRFSVVKRRLCVVVSENNVDIVVETTLGAVLVDNTWRFASRRVMVLFLCASMPSRMYRAIVFNTARQKTCHGAMSTRLRARKA